MFACMLFRLITCLHFSNCGQPRLKLAERAAGKCSGGDQAETQVMDDGVASYLAAQFAVTTACFQAQAVGRSGILTRTR